MTTAQEIEDLEGYSLYISSLLNAMGYSKSEVSIRQSKWEFLEQKENIFMKYNEYVEGCVFSGSSSEGMTGGPYYGGELSDFDCIRILREFQLTEEAENESPEQEQARIEVTLLKEIPDKNFPGYVKLKLVKAKPTFFDIFSVPMNLRYLPNTIITKATEIQNELSKIMTSKNPTAKDHSFTSGEKHGPAVSFQVSEPQDTLSTLSELVGDATSQNLDQGHQTFHRPLTACDIDMVACIKRNKWPELAKSWITRCRFGKWPGESKVESIIQSLPTYLAPVGHKCSSDLNLQWRLSFNAVEKALIKSFNQTQVQCYALLKFYLKDYIREVSANVLSSYCTKTAIFWISESEGTENMTDKNLLKYFIKCLHFIRQCLLDGKMPVYFTGTGSAFPTDMNTNETANVITELDKAIQDPVTPLQKCKSFRFPMHVSEGNAEEFPKLTIRSNLFAWLEMRCGILESVHFCGTKDMLWCAYVAEPIEENIRRYTVLTNETRKLIYCQPLFQMLQSCLGLLCLAKVCCKKQTSEKDYILLQEAEELLVSGQEGDATMCPLRLATFYINQKRPDKVLHITDVILSKADQITDRHLFMETLYKRMHEQFSAVAKINDIEVLQMFMDLIAASHRSKLHEEEILYLRKDCKEAMDFFNCPVVAQRSLSFDATFMLPEAPALPTVLRLELFFSRLFEVTGECRGMKISPILCTYFLRFLACHMLGNLGLCTETLKKYQEALQMEQKFYQARGYNLLAKCFAMIDESQKAAKCLICSLEIDPSRNNVAFGYLTMVYTVLFCKNKE